MFVGGDEQHIHFIDTFVNRKERPTLVIAGSTAIGGRRIGVKDGGVGVSLRLRKSRW